MGSSSTAKTLTVATLLCVVCSFFVSTSVVLLRPAQQRNKALDLKKNLLVSAGLINAGADKATIENSFAKLKPFVVDLDNGLLQEDINVLKYDQRRAMTDATRSKAIVDDIAGIKRRELLSKVYFSFKNGNVDMIILPVYGKGLWSTMYGFLALDSDFNTVRGMGFYEHGETPGLGGEIDNPNWKKLWVGKKIYGAAGELRIEVIKGKVDLSRDGSIHQIDGISGATLTSNGVGNMLRYWMSAQGYYKFIKNLKSKEVAL